MALKRVTPGITGEIRLFLWITTLSCALLQDASLYLLVHKRCAVRYSVAYHRGDV